jgi:outer membrane immunogenic protein
MRGSFGSAVVASLSVATLAFAVGLPAPARAADGFRLPSFSYATDAELGQVNRTGFILSPDIAFFDEMSINGSAGAVLDDPDGISIGGKVGYDQQIGNFVVGVMTDAFYSFADGDGIGAGAGIFESELNYYGTVRGRLGYSFGRFMAYGTAGYAYGELEITNFDTGASESETLNGWTYGGGLEYAWNRDIMLHGGYRRIDFDDQTFSVLPGKANTVSPEMDVFDFGIVTRF